MLWYQSTNGGASFAPLANGGVYSGVTLNTMTITGVTAAMNNYEYEAKFTNSIGSDTTTAATLTIAVAPAITTQPTNQAVNVASNTSFSAAANGNPAPTAQWEVKIAGGTTFTPLGNGGVYSGATTGTLHITGATAALNGNTYEAVFTNSVGSATTAAATLTINNAPSITTQPVSQTVTAGQNVNFTAAASGSPAPTVQWYISFNGGSSFSPLGNSSVYSGVTTDTLKITSSFGGQNGNVYEAIFTNSVGTATTNHAKLTVDFAPTVTTQPVAHSVASGGTTTFTAAASANPAATVQWQVKVHGGTKFTVLSNSGVYSGVTTGTLKITGATSALNGDTYEAVFTNSVGKATTTAVKLTVTNPSAHVTVTAGQSASLTAASGSPATSVVWYVSTDGGATFTPLGNGGGYSGATTNTLSIAGVTSAMNRYQYDAVITNSDGTITIDPVILTVS